MTEVTLAEQIACVDQRVEWLRRCIESCHLSEMEPISEEISTMEAVLATLKGIEDRGRVLPHHGSGP